MVEHTAVNRGVVGSSPTRGAYFGAGYVMYPAFFELYYVFDKFIEVYILP